MTTFLFFTRTVAESGKANCQNKACGETIADGAAGACAELVAVDTKLRTHTGAFVATRSKLGS